MGDANKPQDSCMRRQAPPPAPRLKVATGISVFLLEELGDARVRHAQLTKYIDEATSLIEKSEHRDHFFEVAGHLMKGIPEVLFKMGKALEAAALGVNRLDSDQIEKELKPEKVEELDKALEEVRIRQLRRRSDDQLVPAPSAPSPDAMTQINAGKDESEMNAKTAAYELMQLAKATEETGRVPTAHLLSLIGRLEAGQKTASVEAPKVVAYLRQLASDVAGAPNPSRLTLARQLRNVMADQMPMTSAQVAAAIYQQANSREDVMKGFKESNPSMSDADLEKAADMWEKHKDVVKDQH